MAIILSTPSVAAAGSCDVPASNPPDVDLLIEEHGVENFWEFNRGSDLLSLDMDVFWESTIDNDSASALKMELVPGYMYTFCIKMAPNSDDVPLEPIGDVYLMRGGDWDRYTIDYEMRGDEDFFDVDFLPVEWRDTVDWLPYRDVHAYERISEGEFSVAIDSDGSIWNSLSDALGGSDQEYFLVIDGWDNRRHADSGAAGGAIDVEVLIDVEERMNIPKFTATLLVGSLPLACLIVPFILHSRYMEHGKEEEHDEGAEMPYLDSEADGGQT
tara:strand:- start:5742 stop:6554 length:813 start_codon:yes stop_codon:yes gene_type:complete